MSENFDRRTNPAGEGIRRKERSNGREAVAPRFHYRALALSVYRPERGIYIGDRDLQNMPFTLSLGNHEQCNCQGAQAETKETNEYQTTETTNLTTREMWTF